MKKLILVLLLASSQVFAQASRPIPVINNIDMSNGDKSVNTSLGKGVEVDFRNVPQYELEISLYNGKKLMSRNTIQTLANVPEVLNSYKEIEYTKSIVKDDTTGKDKKEKGVANDGYYFQGMISPSNSTNSINLKSKASINKITSGERLHLGADEKSFIDLYNYKSNQTTVDATIPLNEEVTVLRLSAEVTKENLINKNYVSSPDWTIKAIVRPVK